MGDMARTTFRELGVRVGAGAGYSLCHQGSCEHLLAFADVRRLHALDPQTRSSYPLPVFQVCPSGPGVSLQPHCSVSRVMIISNTMPGGRSKKRRGGMAVFAYVCEGVRSGVRTNMHAHIQRCGCTHLCACL